MTETTASFRPPETSGAVRTGVAVAERLERLPMSGFQILILTLACVAWLIEAFDIGLIGVVLPSLHSLWHLTPKETGSLAAITAVGIVLGVVPSGFLADRFGRKTMLMIGLAWYTIVTGFTALAGSITSLIALRFVAGLGMGMMFPIPYAIVSEFVSSSHRGRFTGVMDSFLSVGYFVSPALAAIIIPNTAPDVGWRVFFILGGIPFLYLALLWRLMPESPRWYESKGRFREAEAAMAGIEAKVEASIGHKLPAVDAAKARPVAVSQEQVPVATIFNHLYLKRTIMCWIAFGSTFFIFYAIQLFMPTVVSRMGFSLTTAFVFTSIIVGASIIGKFLEAWLVETWGRKPVIISFTIVALVCALFFGYLRSPVLVLLVGAAMSFFGISIDPAVKIYVAENYPTRVRGTGVGFSEGVGRLLAGAIAPFYFPFVLERYGTGGSFVFVALVALVGTLAVWLLGEETKGRLLEDVSP
jgi:putative MFS transporter